MTAHEHVGRADFDSISGQLDEAAATERAVNVDRTDRLETIEAGMIANMARIQNVEHLLAENTAETRANALQAQANGETMRAVHEMLSTWRAGMNALAKFGRGLAWIGGWVLRIAKFGGAIAGGIYAIWLLFYTFTHGGPKP